MVVSTYIILYSINYTEWAAVVFCQFSTPLQENIPRPYRVYKLLLCCLSRRLIFPYHFCLTRRSRKNIMICGLHIALKTYFTR